MSPTWLDLIGTKIYVPRLKRSLTFCPFGMEAYKRAAQELIPWPDGLLDMKPEWDELPHLGHPLTIKILERVAKQLRQVGNKDGAIRTNGFYRPPGTTWGTGYYADPHGVYDTHDEWGHWRLAIDIAAATTARSFGVLRHHVVEALAANGFSTPFTQAGEYWHYRPNAAQRARWANR